jgi:NosR/NirI family nitrous oxide reductase transcriptional regulator
MECRDYRWMLGLVVLVVVLGMTAFGEEPAARFPRPDFESGYTPPVTQRPLPRAVVMQWVDVGLLAGAMGLTTWLALKRRSRKGILAVTVFSIVYFGFYRQGCVCSVGAIQNVVLGLSGAGYSVPWPVILFFLLPLVFALFFGRVFCAAVCPLGAIQDVMVRKPVRVSGAVAGLLGFLPVVLLAVSVLLTVAGAGFMICKHDPFVGFYRMGGPVTMVVSGGVLLVLGMFVARPYCRFLCPYGVLLGWMSRLAGRHARITPDKCINCRLCERACPFESIRPSTAEKLPEKPVVTRKRMAWGIVSLPLLLVVGTFLGLAVYRPLARMHPVVRLAERVALEERGGVKGYTLESEAFRGAGQSLEELRAQAVGLRGWFRIGGMLAGAFLGLVLGLRVIAMSRVELRNEYTIAQSTCFSCGRCFEYCPVDKAWREGRNINWV